MNSFSLFRHCLLHQRALFVASHRVERTFVASIRRVDDGCLRKSLFQINLSKVLYHPSAVACQRESRSRRARLSFDEKREKLERKLKSRVNDLRENIATVPNLLTITRIGLTPVISYCVIHGHFLMATNLFVFAGITDLLDGYIARKFPTQKSNLGSLLDPLADKLLISVLTISLTMVNVVPLALTALIIIRDVSLIIAALYIRYLSLPPPRTVLRFFDIQYATTRLYPTAISKWNTAFQIALVAVSIPAPVFGYVDSIALHYMWYLTGATTILSGLSYVFQKGTYKILTKGKVRK